MITLLLGGAAAAAVPSLVQFDGRPLGGANFQYYHCAIAQPYNATTTQFARNTTITQPCNTTITQPCNATIMQPCNATITQRNNNTTLHAMQQSCNLAKIRIVMVLLIC
jgi:hypothetical protein